MYDLHERRIMCNISMLRILCVWEGDHYNLDLTTIMFVERVFTLLCIDYWF